MLENTLPRSPQKLIAYFLSLLSSGPNDPIYTQARGNISAGDDRLHWDLMAVNADPLHMSTQIVSVVEAIGAASLKAVIRIESSDYGIACFSVMPVFTVRRGDTGMIVRR